MGRSKHRKHNKNAPGVPKEGDDPSLVSDPSSIIPKSFVFRRGKIGMGVHSLVYDMRLVMAPNTAAKLKETSANHIKDFLSIAPGLGVTHFIMFSQAATTGSAHLRLVRIPRGPTLSFSISSYTTIRDLTNMQSRPHSHSNVQIEYKYAPLVVLNNFNQTTNTTTTPSVHQTNPVKLMAAMFQNLFPPLDVTKLRLAECRRVVLINYNSGDGSVDFRHFMIEASPVGLTKQVKRIIKAKIPNLNRLDDIADLLSGDAEDYAAQMSSDSEAEDTPETRITLGQHFAGRGNRRSGKSAIRLREIGPRMTLNLIKIEEEFCTGRVLYHAYHTKSEAEQEQLQRMKQQREAEKARRKEQQAANVAAKQSKGRRGKRAREEAGGEEGDNENDEYSADVSYGDGDGADASARDDMNDADWYRLEVGERPERDLFDERESKRPDKGIKRKPQQQHISHHKKARTDAHGDGDGDGHDTQASESESKPFKSRKGRSSKATWIRGRGGKAHNTDRPSSSRGRGAAGAGRGRGRGRGGSGRGGSSSSRGRGAGSRGRGRGR